MGSFNLINPDTIRRNMLGDEQMIKTFVGMYLEHCRADFEQLKQAVSGENRAEMASKAHHIKPTMAYIGALELRDRFQALENGARGTVAMESMVSDFQQLAYQFELMMTELNLFYTELA